MHPRIIPTLINNNLPLLLNLPKPTHTFLIPHKIKPSLRIRHRDPVAPPQKLRVNWRIFRFGQHESRRRPHPPSRARWGSCLTSRPPAVTQPSPTSFSSTNRLSRSPILHRCRTFS